MKIEDGFTLVELIAVVVILGLIGLITFPAVSRIIRESKEDTKKVNADTILNSGYDYVQKHIDKLPTEAEDKSFCVYELVNSGLLKEEIYKEMEGSRTAKIVVSYRTSEETNSNENTYSKYRGNYLFSYVEDGSCIQTEKNVAES